MTQIPLTNNYFAKVDDAYFEMLDRYAWSVEQRGNKRYAVCYLDASDWSRKLLMHRLIMGAQPGQLVDHIDGDGARRFARFPVRLLSLPR